MLSLIIAACSVFLGCSSAVEMKCSSCYRTLFFHKVEASDSISEWKKVLACDNITSCCEAAEQYILPVPRILVTPMSRDIDIKARGNYMDVWVNTQEIHSQELVLSIVYPYNCSMPKTSCQGTEYFTQQMNLTIIIADVNLEVLECDNCTHDDAHMQTYEGAYMKLKCSTNFSDASEYWMEFHGGTSGSRVARCMPHITGTNFETADPGWRVYRNSSTYECILEIPHCRMEDMGTYTCALLVPNNTNHYSKFYSTQKEMNVMEIISAGIITEPPPTESIGDRLEHHLYFGILIGIVSTLVLATVVIIVVLVTRAGWKWWRPIRNEEVLNEVPNGYDQVGEGGNVDQNVGGDQNVNVAPEERHLLEGENHQIDANSGGRRDTSDES